MAISTWVILYVVVVGFWLWVVPLGGAERLEGSVIADLFLHLTSRMDADVIKVIGWVTIMVATAWFVLGLFVPSARLIW